MLYWSLNVMPCRWDPVLLLGAGPALLVQLGLLLLGHAPPAAHLVGPLLSSAAVWAWLHYFAPTTALASLVLTGLSFSQEAGRGRELGGAEAGARAGLQQSLAHTVATQLAQVTGAARTKVRAVDREKVSSAARSLRTLIKSNWRNSAKSMETSAKSKVNNILCVFLTHLPIRQIK